jgi:hypothetical protein
MQLQKYIQEQSTVYSEIAKIMLHLQCIYNQVNKVINYTSAYHTHI